MKAFFMAAAAVLALAACSSDDDEGAAGGSSGAGGSAAQAGSGGSSAGGSSGSGGSSTGGSSGSGGASSGGSAGTATGGSAGAATGGSAGAATGGSAGAGGGASGAAGSAGAAPVSAECTTAADCTQFSDCCSCAALASGETPPPSCPQVCAKSVCESMGLTATDVSCVAGRCVLTLSCDAAEVTCKALPPTCPTGELPSVVNGCWGACIKASDCSEVTNCAACDASLYTCVQYVAQLGPQAHCVPTPAACEKDPSCACMGSSVCIDPFSSCSDLSSVKGIGCSCPVC